MSLSTAGYDVNFLERWVPTAQPSVGESAWNLELGMTSISKFDKKHKSSWGICFMDSEYVFALGEDTGKRVEINPIEDTEHRIQCSKWNSISCSFLCITLWPSWFCLCGTILWSSMCIRYVHTAMWNAAYFSIIWHDNCTINGTCEWTSQVF